MLRRAGTRKGAPAETHKQRLCGRNSRRSSHKSGSQEFQQHKHTHVFLFLEAQFLFYRLRAAELPCVTRHSPCWSRCGSTSGKPPESLTLAGRAGDVRACVFQATSPGFLSLHQSLSSTRLRAEKIRAPGERTRAHGLQQTLHERTTYRFLRTGCGSGGRGGVGRLRCS